MHMCCSFITSDCIQKSSPANATFTNPHKNPVDISEAEATYFNPERRLVNNTFVIMSCYYKMSMSYHSALQHNQPHHHPSCSVVPTSPPSVGFSDSCVKKSHVTFSKLLMLTTAAILQTLVHFSLHMRNMHRLTTIQEM